MESQSFKLIEAYRGYFIFQKTGETMFRVFAENDVLMQTEIGGFSKIENAKRKIESLTENLANRATGAGSAPQESQASTKPQKPVSEQSIESIFEKNKHIANLFEKRGKVNDVRTRLKNLHARSTGVRVIFESDDNDQDSVNTAKFAKECLEFFMSKIEEFFEEINAEIKTAERSAQ